MPQTAASCCLHRCGFSPTVLGRYTPYNISTSPAMRSKLIWRLHRIIAYGTEIDTTPSSSLRIYDNEFMTRLGLQLRHAALCSGISPMRPPACLYHLRTMRWGFHGSALVRPLHAGHAARALGTTRTLLTQHEALSSYRKVTSAGAVHIGRNAHFLLGASAHAAGIRKNFVRVSTK